MDRSRVLVLTHTGDVGGAERAMLRLIAASDARFEIGLLTLADGPLVAEARRAGVKVRVVDGGDVVRVTRAESGRLRTLFGRATSTVSLVRRLRSAIAAADADLVVANSLKAAVLYALVPGRKPRWVWHLHDRLAPDYLPAIVATVLRALARLPRAIVANSLATARTVGRGPRRTVVAYPGVEPALFEAPERAAAPGPVGMLGRVSATKGQSEFVAAAPLVRRRHPEAEFVIVGDALFEDRPYADALRDVIGASEARDALEWRGWTEDPGATLRGFGVFVHASPVPEPFGQVIVEAMAAGTPVIATDAGGAVEILDPDRRAEPAGAGVRRAPYGLLVRPGDSRALATAIVQFLDDPVAAAERAEAAVAHARARFAIERTWETVASVWTAALR